jgi:hypothetical protein
MDKSSQHIAPLDPNAVGWAARDAEVGSLTVPGTFVAIDPERVHETARTA